MSQGNIFHAPKKNFSLAKRERKPLAIVDPTSNKTVVVQTVAPPTNTSSANSTKPTTDSTDTSAPNSICEEKRAAFRSQFAQLLNSGSPNDKVTKSIIVSTSSNLCFLIKDAI